jgi:energy-coupling factor transport system permease protein
VHPLAELLLYRRSDSTIFRLDSRVRFTVALTILLLTLFARSFVAAAFLLVVMLALAFLGKALSRLGRMALYSSPFIAILSLLNLSIGFTFPELSFVAVKLYSFIAAATLVFLVITPDEVEYVMRWLRLPRNLTFVSVTALRFVPLLLIELNQILDAQRSRGLEVEGRGVITRLRSLKPIFIPMLIGVVSRANELAEALESRAYGAVRKPTMLHAATLTRADLLALLGDLSLLVVFLYLPSIDMGLTR